MKRILLILLLMTGNCFAGVIAQWKMNDDAASTDVVDSIGGNTGTASQNTEDMNVVGKINGALSFNGTDDEVLVAADPAIDAYGKTAMSISAWIYPKSDGEDNTGRIIDKYGPLINGYRFYLSAEAGGVCHLTFYLYTDGTNMEVVKNGGITINKWNHIVFTYNEDANRKGKLYINGALQTLDTDVAGTDVLSDDSVSDLCIGNRSDGERTFDGYIDNLMIFDEALNQTEIDSLYNDGDGTERSGSLDLVDGAIAQWKMNDDMDDNVIADSINSCDGAFHGTGGADDYTSAHTTTGHINAAIELDGTNDYITVGDDDIFTPDGTPFSITAWVSLSADDGALDFMLANKMGTALEWDFRFSADDLYFTLYDQSASQAKIGRADSTTNYSNWEGAGFIFVVCTYDGGVLSSGVNLYLNGDSVDDSDDINGTFANVDNSNEDIYIGKEDISMAKGVIDNLVIYDTELTQSQITSLYNNGVGTEEAGSVDSNAENIARSRTKYGYRKYYRNRY